ncbi:MAG: nicotinate-nucleotide adenylyltransferase [bacterium]
MRSSMSNTGTTRIGILGGSFDPIHIGHLIVADGVADRMRLDSVLFIPCHTPPHKSAANLSAGEHRLRMVELAVKGDPRFRACDAELSRGGISYSVDTIATLKSRYARGTEFYFIVGADSMVELETWRECKKLLSLCTVVTAARPGWDLDSWQPREGAYTHEEIAALKGHVGEYIIDNNLYVSREGEGRECETAKERCERVR